MNAKRESIQGLLSNIAVNLELVDHLVTRAELGKPWGDKQQAVNNMFISLEDMKAVLVSPKPVSRHIVTRKTVKRKSRKKAAYGRHGSRNTPARDR